MLDGAGNGAAASVFDGLIQNALGTWGENEKIKPLIVSMTETWPPNKHKFISELAATIFSGNDCPNGQESAKALQAVQRAETLYKILKKHGHM